MSRSLRYRLGTILVDEKVITKDQLAEALEAQNGTDLRIGEILIKKNLASEEQILNALGHRYNISTEFKLTFDYSDTDHLKNIPAGFLKRHKIVPFRLKNDIVSVAIIDPLNIQPLDDLKMLFPSLKIEPVLSREDEVARIINTHFDAIQAETSSDVIEDLEGSEFELLNIDDSISDDIMDMANEAPIIRLVNTMIKQAVADRASDIHIEPYENELAVRYRIDGILYKILNPPKKFQSAVISRIKIMANLNIAENRLPQDGRIQLKIGGKDIDIRVSIFPTYFGERVVLRILNKSDMDFNLESLGFDEKTLHIFNDLIKKTYGIILATGPTGSGKSTTLYSVLSTLNQPDVNILTVEDPIEYQIKGIGQMQVKPKIELTFANGLRSILRQDPDIVMVGEIRDRETAEIAVQAALTGHKVFSTLHTNDAASGITRLIDMGVEPFLIASSVNAFLAQRLARKICPKCKEAYKPSQKLLDELNIKISKLKNGRLFRGKGCDACLKTGYSGRVGIYELLPLTQNIRKLVMGHSDSNIIKEQAIKDGMKTLLDDGTAKAIDGVTTIEEVMRVCL